MGFFSDLAERLDGWNNLVTGFGTSKDKTTYTTFCPSVDLSDWQLTALYKDNDLAGRIVDVYPRTELSGGFQVKGFDGAKKEDIDQFLKPWSVKALVIEARVWARNYGGAAIFLGEVNADSVRLVEPLQDNAKIAFLRVIDKRYLKPVKWYDKPEAGAKIGQPEIYHVSADSNGIYTIGFVHESRLIRFGGARTDNETRRGRDGWELSVLQRPYEALRSAGDVWKSSELQVAEANLGIYKIKNFMGMIAGKSKDAMLERLRILDMSKGMRGIVLDADSEQYDKIANQFTGLADLNDKAIERVAAAAEMPVTILMGRSPAGMNATGASDLHIFYRLVEADRELRCEPQLLQLLRVLLQQDGSPVRGQDMTKLGVAYGPLHVPTAAELADIRVKRATEATAYIGNQVLMPHEVALSLGDDSGWEFDRELREAEAEAFKSTPEETDEAARAETPTEGAELEEAAPDAEQNADTSKQVKVIGPAPAPAKAGAPIKPGAAPAPDAGTVADEAMNGAQVTSLVEVVRSVHAGEIPRESGIGILQVAFKLSPDSAAAVMGPEDFEPVKPEPTGFGGPPGAGGFPPKGKPGEPEQDDKTGDKNGKPPTGKPPFPSGK